jgi:hypothetical protein
MDDVSVKIPDNTEPLGGSLFLHYGRGCGGWECWVTSAAQNDRATGNKPCNPTTGETPREAAWRVILPELARLRDHHADVSKRFASAIAQGFGDAPTPEWLKRA